MSGLFFLSILGIWLLIAVLVGTKIPKWLGATRYRRALSVLLIPLIFLAPVADEIVAYPQMLALCKHDKLYELATGMNEKKAYGRTVYYVQKKELISLWPSTVKVSRLDMAYVDAQTNETVLARIGFRAAQGMLGLPAGSSGDKTTVLLSGCGSRIEAYDAKGLPSRFSHLNLTKTPTP